MATTLEMRNVFSALPSLLSVSPHVWFDYDRDADVLYISFRKPQQATDSVLEDNIAYHYDGDTLVGVTVIGAKSMFMPSIIS
jgi:uncharacterized protein YuzE